ncbi:RluA family pseudouridine synthase [Blattabacterium cuenoti]|uniref:Pseudouridine synthase n=1 Tax=Blattabacterium cuenoti STAT TaxID=1457030 RepID=A0A224AJU5_9FLAO|nr:RluA family pseudouridine synthase [Blattabacterium cuenoti]BBA17421.1 ribosomal large subunit pseudouridine synthaseD [Blattabacterium cuenoti STAT]
MKIIQIFVKKNQREIRIDKFLKKNIENISRNQIQKLISSKKVIVNQIFVKKNYKIQPLDFIKVQFYDIYPTLDYLEYENIVAEKINLHIIHEDEDLIVINKPAGMVVHPGFGHDKGTLIHGIKYHFQNSNLNDFNLYRSGLVHRLDKDTSGLLVIAKNEFSKEYLFQQFHSKTIQREYRALIWGNLSEEKGIITGFIGRDPKNRKRMTVFRTNEFCKGKYSYSITHYQVLERFKYLTYVSCRIKTGKTHQIRAHFKYLGHPLFHDSIYGGHKILMKKKCSSQIIEFFRTCLKILPRQALHAISLSFIHPKHKKCYFYCPIPEDFKIVLNKCRKILL